MKAFKLIIIILALSTGCTIIKAPDKDIVCPPPVSQQCQPKKFSGTSMDTSEAYRRIADEYYIFDPVSSLNTSDNEWGLSFIDRKTALLTLEDNDEQRMIIAKFLTDTKARIESGIGSPFDGSSGSISFRGNNLIVAATNDPDNPDEFIGNSNLYSAELDGNVIRYAKYLGDKLHKDKLSWESHPSLSADGTVLFFASDRELKKGVDLFFSFKAQDGTWSEPYNLGDSINTDCEEITPFVTEDGSALYFSSCGHETVGGYDIFVSKIKPEFWQIVKSSDKTRLNNIGRFFSKATNLRAPLNTPADEIFPSSPENPDNLIYYASNQANQGANSILYLRGGFDIFRRRKIDSKLKPLAEKKIDINIDINNRLTPVEIPTDLIFAQTYKLKGTVYNAQTKQVVPFAELYIRQIDGETPTLQRENKIDPEDYLGRDREVDITAQGGDRLYDNFKITADEKGYYEVTLEKDRTYEVTAQKEDMFFDSFKTRMEKEDPRNETENDLFVPPSLTLRINFPSDVYKNPYKFTLDSYGIETNQTWIEAINLLAQNILLTGDKIETLILIGHTDDQGSEEYNYRLGLNRVNYIIDQLVRRGVPRDKLEGRSEGEYKLLEREPEESIKMWRKRCRRVELVKELK